MAFIFDQSRDPRGETVVEFQEGSKVKYRDMVMPAVVLSGPHPSNGRDRYLIRKADGNVSLVPVTTLEQIVTRVDQVARMVASMMFGRSYEALHPREQIQVGRVASRLLHIADDTRGQD